MTAATELSEAGASPLASYRFRLTRDDIAAFERLPRELVGRDKLLLVGPALLGGLLLGAFEDEIYAALPMAVLGKGTSTLILAFVALVPLSYAAAAALLSLRTAWRIRTAALPATDTVVDTFGDHVAVQEDATRRFFAWEMVRVIAGKTHVFLCPAPRQAVILPLRAFASEADMRAFAEWAEMAGRDIDDVSSDDDEGVQQ